ncbi:MAG: hypothetical protein ACXABY_19055 [Candidatus Thorarchaeota archaeon]
MIELPLYYQLEIQFTSGKISRYIATSEIISDLYERGYKEWHDENGHVQAIGSPYPYAQDLIARDKKLMILGAGRSGTTFLIKLLTRLGLYTGYYPYKEFELGNTRAGCEFGIFSLGEMNQNFNSSMTRLDETHIQEVFDEFAAAPFVIKSPANSYWYFTIRFHSGILLCLFGIIGK